MKNPLYDIQGKFQWDAFLSIFGIAIIPAAMLVSGAIAGIAGYDTLFFGVLFGAAVANLIYGSSSVAALVIALIAIPINEHTAHVVMALAINVFVWVAITYNTNYVPPFFRFIKRMRLKKKFGCSF